MYVIVMFVRILKQIGKLVFVPQHCQLCGWHQDYILCRNADLKAPQTSVSVVVICQRMQVHIR